MLDNVNINLDLNQLATQIGKPLSYAVQSIKNIFDSVFMELHYSTEEKRIRFESNLKDFEKQISINLQQIPKEHLKEPKSSVIGPALEASKYYIEENKMRSMFAKLIANSSDNRLNSTVRTSFTEFIKQLEPIDALILKEL